MVITLPLGTNIELMPGKSIPKHIKQSKEVTLTNKVMQLERLNHIIAHNLRGSIANIKMLAELLSNKNIPDDCHAEKDEDAFTTTEAIQYINESSASLLATLSTLMEVSEIQLNEKIKYDECDIASVVQHIIKQLRGSIHEKQATIEHDLSISHIKYPMAYMESILYNFINNALKYCKDGIQLKITISTYIQDGRPVLTVKDNGLGIDLQAYGRRIFNLYQVFHPGYESKGVGLYIIKTQIESLGGTVSVKSKVNEGSEFIVVF